MSRRTEITLWVGLFAAPIAWAGSHVVGWAASEAHCEPVNTVWGISLSTWEIVLLVVAALLAIAGTAGAAMTYWRVRGTDNDADPPAGTVWMLSISGLVIGPLMLMMILLTHIGALALRTCYHA